MADNKIPDLYVSHDGTIRISGGTVPRDAGKCAMHYLEQGKHNIDFLCIGANANQQATKSMGVFMLLFERNPDNKGKTLAFRPLRFRVMTEDRQTHASFSKDATAWRTVVVVLSP